MFYLKYRPKTLGEIDNSNVKEQIVNILKSKQIPHALLFVGQKGTGKTSTARVFAKSINCFENMFAGKNKSIEPCNTCKNCKNVDSSNSTDVIELDAASNRGIEEVKRLIREAAFLPMGGRYRVFIIDEAHMITPDAFNALLKTLEEPPKSAVFILATTNQEKLPKTILSRCFLLNFGKAKKKDIIHMLNRIIKEEKIKIDEKLLDLIYRNSDHSFRDATKTLEELVIQEKLTLEDGKKFLGVLSKENLLKILSEKDLKQALSWLEEFSQAGGNHKHLIEQLLDDLRKQLLVKNAIGVEDVEETLNFSTSQIAYLMRLLNEAYSNLKITPIEAIALEIAIVDFYNSRNNKQQYV